MTTPTTSTDLASWLLAQIDADEAAARHRDVVTFGAEQRAVAGIQGPFDPARVLAQVAAVRAVVELHRPTREYPNTSGPDWRDPELMMCSRCVALHADMDCENERWPCPTLRALAAPYAGADGWQEAWE